MLDKIKHTRKNSIIYIKKRIRKKAFDPFIKDLSKKY